MNHYTNWNLNTKDKDLFWILKHFHKQIFPKKYSIFFSIEIIYYGKDTH